MKNKKEALLRQLQLGRIVLASGILLLAFSQGYVLSPIYDTMRSKPDRLGDIVRTTEIPFWIITAVSVGLAGYSLVWNLRVTSTVKRIKSDVFEKTAESSSRRDRASSRSEGTAESSSRGRSSSRYEVSEETTESSPRRDRVSSDSDVSEEASAPSPRRVRSSSRSGSRSSKKQ